MATKFSSAQIAFLRETGTVVDGRLIIALSALVEAGPSRTRTGLDEKRAKLHGLVKSILPDEKGVRRISVEQLHVAGLPGTYLTNGAAWSGVSEASELVAELGLSAKYHSTFLPGKGMDIGVTLSAMTAKELEKREKQRASAAAKELARRAADAAAKAASADTDGGAAETDDDGIPDDDSEETDADADADANADAADDSEVEAS